MKRLIFLVLVILCSSVVFGEQQTIDYFRAPTNLVGPVDVYVGSVPKLTFTPESGAHTYHVKTSYLGSFSNKYKIEVLNEDNVVKHSVETLISVGTNNPYTAQFVYTCDGVCREQQYIYKAEIAKNVKSSIRYYTNSIDPSQNKEYPDESAGLEARGGPNEPIQEVGDWDMYLRCAPGELISNPKFTQSADISGCNKVFPTNDYNFISVDERSVVLLGCKAGNRYGYAFEWTCTASDQDQDGFYPPQDCDDTNSLLTTFCPEDLSGTATTCNGGVSYGVDAYSSWNHVCDGLKQGGTGGIGTGCCESACGSIPSCDEKGSEDPLCVQSCGVTENCKNGIDDNKDTLIDNADPVCDPDLIIGRCGLEGYTWIDDSIGGKCCGDDGAADNFDGLNSACVGGVKYDNGALLSNTQLVVDGAVVICSGSNLCQGVDVGGNGYYCSNNGWSSEGYSGVKASERTSLKNEICCSESSCNSNGACVQNQRDNPTSASINGNRCWDGDWISSNNFVTVKAWDGVTTGYCKADQCLSLDFDNVAGGCFDVNGYVGDHYCINSGTSATWTSRTKYLIEDMLKYTSDKGVTDYVLICDSADKVLNDIDYNIYTATGIYSVINYLNNANNICLLKYGSDVLLGTTLNSIGGSFDFFETIDLDDKSAEKTIDCSGAEAGYFKCSGGDVVFNKDLGVVIFGAKSSFGGSSVGFFRGLLDGIVGFFTSKSDISAETSLISGINDFNVLYFNKASGKSVFGVSEYVSGNPIMSIQYNGFSTSLCSNFAGLDCGAETVGSNVVTRVAGAYNEASWRKNVASLRFG